MEGKPESNLHVPFVCSPRKDQLIAVIDASGSMQHCWPMLARVFNRIRSKDTIMYLFSSDV